MLVVVDMRYLAVDRLIHPMDSHLLVDRSADMLDHRTVDMVLVPDSGNLEFDSDIQEQVDIDPMDLDTVRGSADIPALVEVDLQVGTHQVVVVHVAADLVDIHLGPVVAATTF